MTQRRVICTMVSVFMLIGCASQASPPMQTAAPTALPTEVPSKTPIPALTAETLEPLLYQPEDLPGTLKRVIEHEDEGPAYPDPVADFIVTKYVEVTGPEADSTMAPLVEVYVYDERDKVLPQHRAASQGLISAAVINDQEIIRLAGLGEDAVGMGLTFKGVNRPPRPLTDIYFTRCRARVFMRLNRDDLPMLESYARKLDARITPIVCREAA